MKQIFESENIYFFPVDVSLAPDYLKMINDMENVGRWIIKRTEPVTEESEIEWVKRKLDIKEPIFSMIEKATGEFIGNIEFMDSDGVVGELGIAITADKQDKGFGCEAIPAMIRYGIDVLHLQRIFLKVFPDNARAIRVYEKCRFKEYDRSGDDVFMEYIGE